MKEKGEVVFYDFGSGDGRIEVKLEHETVWLTQDQMADLFQKSKSTINEHIKNIYNEKELEDKATMNKFGNSEFAKKPINYYSLDVIISVGYRVKSIRGTQFRIWANKVLKDYLTNGYAIDQKRFQEQSRQLDELKQTVKLLGNVVGATALNTDEATGLLRVVTDYAYALDVLDRYDHQVLEIEATSPTELFQITYGAAMGTIKGLKDKFGGERICIRVWKKRLRTCCISS
jgi:hypothetical protein